MKKLKNTESAQLCTVTCCWTCSMFGINGLKPFWGPAVATVKRGKVNSSGKYLHQLKPLRYLRKIITYIDTQTHPDTPRHTHIHPRHTQRHPVTHTFTPRHSQTHPATPRHTHWPPDTPSHTQTHTFTPSHTQTHTFTPRHTQTNTDLGHQLLLLLLLLLFSCQGLYGKVGRLFLVLKKNTNNK